VAVEPATQKKPPGQAVQELAPAAE